MAGEPLGSFLFKQLFGIFLGFIIASGLDFGKLFYNKLQNTPICKVELEKKNSAGYFYNWNITIKKRTSGSFMIYPQPEALIELNTFLRPERVVDVKAVGKKYHSNKPRGMIVTFLEGKENIDIKFRTYSGNFFNYPTLEGLQCSDLLVDI